MDALKMIRVVKVISAFVVALTVAQFGAMWVGTVMLDVGTLAYTTERYASYDVTLVDVRTNIRHHLLNFTTAYMGELSWSPDGEHMAFAAWYRGGINLHMLNMKTRETTQVTTIDARIERPTWTHDGEQIVYGSEGEIYIVDVQSGIQLQILQDQQGRSPALSNDGTTLAFSSRIAGNNHIYTLSMQTGDRQQITSTTADDKFPAWSPDGTRLAFMRWNNQYDIYTLDLVSGVEKPLITRESLDGSPAWSVNGRYLAYVSLRSGWQDVYVMDMVSGTERRITALSARNEFVTWMP